MSIRAAQPGLGTGPGWPTHLRAGPARHYHLSGLCRACPQAGRAAQAQAQARHAVSGRASPQMPGPRRAYRPSGARITFSQVAMAADLPYELKGPWGMRGFAGWRPPPRARSAGLRRAQGTPPASAARGHRECCLRRGQGVPAVNLRRAQAQGTLPPPRVGRDLLS
jgi:hypothetical protein